MMYDDVRLPGDDGGGCGTIRAMMARFARARRLRRVAPWFLAPVLGVAGALATATPGSAAAASCSAAYRLTSYWTGTDGLQHFNGNFDVTNTGTTATTTWTVRFNLLAGVGITGAYNANRVPQTFTPTYTNSVINGVIAPGRSTSWGFIAKSILTTAGARYPQNVTCTAT